MQTHRTSARSGHRTLLLLCILCTMLLAAIAWSAVGCTSNQNATETLGETLGETLANTAPPIVKGEGATVFALTVTFADQSEKVYEIHTDKTTVGEALLELGLIAGEESSFGLYVKSVDGVVADYDVDGTYWAFYINGEYASTGVDVTTITPGATYAFKVSK